MSSQICAYAYVEVATCDYYDNAIIRIIAYKQSFLFIIIIMWIVA